MRVPGVVATHLVVVEADFVLRGLERFLDALLARPGRPHFMTRAAGRGPVIASVGDAHSRSHNRATAACRREARPDELCVAGVAAENAPVTQPPQSGPVMYWYLPGYAPPPPPPPPPRRRYLLAAVIGGLAFVMCCAGLAVATVVGLYRMHATAAPQPGTVPAASTDPVTSPAPPVTTCDPDDGNPDGVARRYLLDPPPGATTIPSGDCVLTSAQVTSDLPDRSRDGALLLYGSAFAGGATRQWVTSNGTTVLIDLIQFRTPANALEYFTTEKAAGGKALATATARPVPGVPRAVTYVVPQPTETYSYAVKANLVLFVKTTADANPDSVTANDTLARQYARI